MGMFTKLRSASQSRQWQLIGISQ